MPLDPPLVLTHDHDPNIVFRGQSLVQHPQSPLSYDDLRSKSHHLSLVYHDLLSRHRILADAHQALKAEHSVLRSSYASLASKHQEYGDDAINSRIQSWRYVVRVEELEKELRLLRQGNAHSMCVCCARFASCAYCSFQNERTNASMPISAEMQQSRNGRLQAVRTLRVLQMIPRIHPPAQKLPIHLGFRSDGMRIMMLFHPVFRRPQGLHTTPPPPISGHRNDTKSVTMNVFLRMFTKVSSLPLLKTRSVVKRTPHWKHTHGLCTWPDNVLLKRGQRRGCLNADGLILLITAPLQPLSQRRFQGQLSANLIVPLPLPLPREELWLLPGSLYDIP